MHTAMDMGDKLDEPTVNRYLLQQADWKVTRDTISQKLEDTPFPTGDPEMMQSYIQETT